MTDIKVTTIFSTDGNKADVVLQSRIFPHVRTEHRFGASAKEIATKRGIDRHWLAKQVASRVRVMHAQHEARLDLMMLDHGQDDGREAH